MRTVVDVRTLRAIGSRVVRSGALAGVLALTVALGLAIGLGVGAPTPAAAQGPAPADAISASRFSLTIDNVEIASFSELLELSVEVEPSDYMDSSTKETSYTKLPGKLKWPIIVLKRGMTGRMELSAWHQAVREGQMAAARKSASLTMYSTDGKPIAKYWLTNAWPTKVEIGALKAGSSEILYETVTLTAENVQRVSPQ